MEDHRFAYRWPINWQARIKQKGEEEFRECTIKDVNFKGAQLAFAGELLVDSYIYLTIIISESLVFNVDAWVAWRRSVHGMPCYGIVFTKFLDADKEALHRFIQHGFPFLIKKQLIHDMTEKGGEDMEDRRTFERFSASFPMRVLDPTTGAEVQACSFDVSAKGVGILAKEKLSPHTPVEMWLAVPDAGEPIYGRGEVTWSRAQGVTEYRCGINLERANLMGLSRVLRVQESQDNS